MEPIAPSEHREQSFRSCDSLVSDYKNVLYRATAPDRSTDGNHRQVFQLRVRQDGYMKYYEIQMPGLYV